MPQRVPSESASLPSENGNERKQTVFKAKTLKIGRRITKAKKGKPAQISGLQPIQEHQKETRHKCEPRSNTSSSSSYSDTSSSQLPGHISK